MRRVRPTIIFFLLASAVLVAVLLVRAGLVKSRQVRLEPPAALAIDPQAAAERLAGAIRWQTISRQESGAAEPGPFLELHRYLERSFPQAHRALTRDIPAGYSLLYTWPGRDPAAFPILLLGHLDVVPVEPGTEREWTHPPFSGTVSDGFIWGRGAMDFKVAVTGVLEAVEALVAEGFAPSRTVLLAFGHDEEIGGKEGAAKIAELLDRRGVRPEIILDEGLAVLRGIVPGIAAPVAMIGIAEKGYVSVELIAQGKGGHSSMPPRQTAVGILAEALHKLESHPMPRHLEGPARAMLEFLAPDMPFPARVALTNLWLARPLVERALDQSPPTSAILRTTFAVTMLEGSLKENVLPQRARAVVNIRVHPSDRIDDVVAHIARVVNDPRVEARPLPGTANEASGLSPVDAPTFAALQAVIAGQFPQAVVAPGLVLGATDSRHYRRLTEHVYGFTPIPIGRRDTIRIHGTDERLGVGDYATAVSFYAEVIRRLAGAADQSGSGRPLVSGANGKMSRPTR